jgi:hypothetical protein
LAWCAGFLAFWAPGGLGVRELVFIGVMRLIAPLPIQGTDFTAMLAFFSVLTRVWAVAGELILASIAYGLDFRGAIGSPDAPGRMVPGEESHSIRVIQPSPNLIQQSAGMLPGDGADRPM